MLSTHLTCKVLLEFFIWLQQSDNIITIHGDNNRIIGNNDRNNNGEPNEFHYKYKDLLIQPFT